MPTTPLRTVFACLLALTVAACAGNPVRSDGGWAEDAARDLSFSRVLVVGVSPDVNQRCAFEDSMAQALQQLGTAAQSACAVLGSKEPLSRESVEKAIAATGADAVLATRPMGGSVGVREGGTHETRGAGYYKPTGFGYAYDYWGPYGMPVVYGEFQTAPAEFVLQGKAQVSSGLFQAGSAALVYSVDTEAARLESREQGLVTVTSSIAAQLRGAGLLR